MNEIILSFAIPTYNRSQKLNFLLNTLSRQINHVFENKVEIVISDNASTDDTKEIVETFIKYNPNLSILYNLNKDNLGFDINVHKSIDCSSGKYVWVIGDDDKLKDNAVKNVFNALNSEMNYSFCFVNYDLNVNGDIYQNHEISNKTFALRGEEMFIRTNFSSCFVSSNIFNKKIWKKFNFEEYFDTAWYHFFASRDIVIGSDVLIVGSPQITQSGGDFYTVRREKINEKIDGLEFYMSAHIKFLHFAFSLEKYGYSEYVIKTAKKIGRKDNLRQIIYYKLTRDSYSIIQISTTINKMIEFFGKSPIFWLIHVPILLAPKFIIRAFYYSFLPIYKRFNKY